MSSKPHQNVRWYSTKTFRFLSMLSLTFSFFIVELVVGNITNSLALVADAFHMFSDVIALVIGLTAIRIAKRRSDINTFGWARAEVVGANINTIALLALSLTIVFDTIKRYIKPEPIVNVNLLLIVGSTGLGINIIGLFLFQGFHGHSHGGGTHGGGTSGGEADGHGHAHGGETHGGEADGHGHAHGGETHGGEADGHGHAHGGETHGGEADGHAHDANDRSRSVEISKTNTEINEDATISNENNRTAATHSDDIEPLEIIIGSSDFKRYSLRALDEAIIDCTTHVHDNSHSHSHGSAQATHNPSSNVDTVDTADSTMKKVKQKKAPSMNMHGIFLHVLADALGSIVVIISSLIIKFVPHNPNDTKHWTVYVDPTLSLLIVIIITISAIPLLKETTLVLLQAAPKNIEIASLKKLLLDQVPEIDGIHDLHVWRLTSNATIATAHLHRKSFTDYMTVANKVKRFFHGLDIHSTTIQYEHQNDESQDYLINNNKESDKSRSTKIECLVSCPEDACDTKTCCPKDLIDTDGALSTNNNNSAQNKSTSALNIAVEMTDEQPRSRTTSEHTRIGASNNGFIAEKF